MKNQSQVSQIKLKNDLDDTENNKVKNKWVQIFELIKLMN